MEKCSTRISAYGEGTILRLMPKPERRTALCWAPVSVMGEKDLDLLLFTSFAVPTVLHLSYY